MEGKSLRSTGLEWKDLALYCRKPTEFQEQICFCFPMSSSGSRALCGNDLGTCSSSKYPISCAAHESTVAHCRSAYEDLFSLHNLGGTLASPPACSTGLRLSRPRAKSSVSSSPMKRSRASYHNLQNPCCQVEGCNLDLKSAKDYHRRHRICENHSKSPKVVVAGMERRFCQQCSRFHDLSEFDDMKRSCRRRLSDHNARRRRAQPESFQLISQGLPSAFYGHKIEHDLLFNGLPIPQTGAVDRTLCFSGDETLQSISGVHLDSTRNIMDQSSQMPNANSPIIPDLLSTAPSLLSSSPWTLNESETHHAQGLVPGNYIPTIRHFDSESQPLPLFHPNHSPISVPIPLMNTIATADPPPAYRLFKSGNLFLGNP